VSTVCRRHHCQSLSSCSGALSLCSDLSHPAETQQNAFQIIKVSDLLMSEFLPQTPRDEKLSRFVVKTTRWKVFLLQRTLVHVRT